MWQGWCSDGGSWRYIVCIGRSTDLLQSLRECDEQYRFSHELNGKNEEEEVKTYELCRPDIYFHV